MLGATRQEAHDWADGAMRLAELFKGRERKAGGPVSDLAHLLKVAIYSNDGVLRSLGWEYGRSAGQAAKDVINEIADLFHAPAGKVGKAVGETYHAAVEDRTAHYMNRLRDVLAPFDKLGRDEQKALLAQLGNLVANPGRITDTPVGRAAKALGAMLKELHDYQTKAGVELGEVKRGYLPRVEDAAKILARPAEFKRDVANFLVRKMGATREAARASAEEWFQRVLMGDMGVRVGNSDFVRVGAANGAPRHTQGRILSKDADRAVAEGGLADWYLRNPAEVLPQYIMRATRRAEWTRRMGADLEKWADYKKRLIDAGGGEAIPEIVRTLESATGMMAAGAGGRYGRIGGALRSWGAVQFLSRAVYSSLAEPFLAAMRTGNAADALKSYGITLHQWTAGIRNTKNAALHRAMAEDLGLISRAIDDVTLQHFAAGSHGASLSKAIQAGFFSRTGLHAYTEATRIASMRVGQVFLRRLAADVMGEGRIAGLVPTGAAFQRSAGLLLKELGIADTDHAAFARWVAGHEADGGVTLEAIRAGDRMGDLYRTALSRFDDQTILRPNASTRARYANHPLGGLIYNLQSYNYAFQKNVLNRTFNIATQAVRGNGLGVLERAQMLAPLGMLPALFGINMALNELRDVVYYDPARDGQKPDTLTDKLARGASRTGLTGSLDLPYNMVFDSRYQRDPATVLLGPILGAESELFATTKRLVTDKNSGHTNTAERQWGRAIYNTIVAPTINAGASLLPGKVGFAAGAAAIQVASHPAIREGFVRALAGPPAPSKRRR